jgi:hypothetical protein
MSLRISDSGNTRKITFDSYVQLERVFKCKGTDDFELNIICPLDLDASHNLSEVDVFFLRKRDIKENEAHEVFDAKSDTRIGWCFPISALSSTEHDAANNEHFLPYAFLGALACIEVEDPCDFFTRVPVYREGAELDLPAFFRDDVAVLVLNKIALASCQNFRLERLIPSLFSWGYVLASKNDAASIKHLPLVANERKMKLWMMSENVPNQGYIEDTFTNILANDDRALSRFFFSYQLVELLIHDVLKNSCSNFVRNISKVNTTDDYDVIAKEIESFQEKTKQLSRIKLLTSRSVSGEVNIEMLKNACNDFCTLNHCKKKSENIGECIYNVRNLLFHQYRNLTSGGSAKLVELNNEFLKLVIYIICNYQHPD